MKLLVVLTIVIAVLFADVAHAKTLYQLEWQSTIPIDTNTIVIDVVGSNGVVVATANTEDATSGWVWITADRACVTATWKAQTVTGAGVVVVRQWDGECSKLYFPISAQDTLSGELP